MHLVVSGAHCGDGENQLGYDAAYHAAYDAAHKYAEAGRESTFIRLKDGGQGRPENISVEGYRPSIREGQR